mgnify:CR=1 FL=1
MRSGGQIALRIDDLDTPRNRPGAEASILADLVWLGLCWDGPLIRQSERRGLYATVLSSLRRAGVVRVRAFTQLFSAAKCLASRYRPVGNRLAIITNGGGPAVLAADWANDLGLEVARLGDASRVGLAPLLGSQATLGQVIDLGEEATGDQYAAALKADAVILADIGLIDYAARTHPELRLHLSVQAAAATPEAIAFYRDRFNVARVVLPRVLTVEEIARLTAHAAPAKVLRVGTQKGAVLLSAARRQRPSAASRTMCSRTRGRRCRTRSPRSRINSA